MLRFNLPDRRMIDMGSASSVPPLGNLVLRLELQSSTSGLGFAIATRQGSAASQAAHTSEYRQRDHATGQEQQLGSRRRHLAERTTDGCLRPTIDIEDLS